MRRDTPPSAMTLKILAIAGLAVLDLIVAIPTIQAQAYTRPMQCSFNDGPPVKTVSIHHHEEAFSLVWDNGLKSRFDLIGRTPAGNRVYRSGTTAFWADDSTNEGTTASSNSSYLFTMVRIDDGKASRGPSDTIRCW